MHIHSSVNDYWTGLGGSNRQQADTGIPYFTPYLLCLEMHSESSFYSLCLTWPRLELCLTDRRYNNKLFVLAYIEVFKFADNLVDSRLEITYPLALISSPNWRTQQQRAKIRDIFALCFRHEALLIVQQYMKHAIYINIIYIFCLFN